MVFGFNDPKVKYVTEGGVSAKHVIKEIALQLLKASEFIEVTELPIVNDTKPVQLEKAEMSIKVIEFGMVKDPDNPLQLKKAADPIEVTEFEIVSEVKHVAL